MNIILVFYLFFFVAPISTIIHESGHMIGAKLAKADHIKLSVGTGRQVLTLDFNKILIIVHALFFVGGQTESTRETPYKLLERAFITFCGPVMNIIFAFIFYFFYIVFINEYLLFLFLFNGWLAGVNLIPFKLKERQSDGYIVLKMILKK